MKKREILAELTRIAFKIGIKIIEDKLLKKGGYCRVFKNKYIIMDKRISEEDKLNILIKALKRNNLENIYLTPKIRELCSEKE
ncbi:hypothetical protein JW879_07300 [candidate division WOR-3 bacterium]|nr:hypothetical protein [candidate division WOR-3 bacterium]